MSIDELYRKLVDLEELMNESVIGVDVSATDAQEAIYKALLVATDTFDTEDGKLVPSQSLAAKMARIERNMYDMLDAKYLSKLEPYFSTYNTVLDQSVSLHKSFNDLEVSLKSLAPQRQAIYGQAEYYLTEGLADAYVQPAKYLMMQQVTAGLDISMMRTALRQWNEGTLPKGKIASDMHAPRLQAYATQLARDTLYTYQGAIQETISDQYDLKKFIYVGDLIADSRPICVHLVGLRRKIALSEIPDLVKRFPDGLKPNTNSKNFLQVRGGYGCRHTCMSVR